MLHLLSVNNDEHLYSPEIGFFFLNLGWLIVVLGFYQHVLPHIIALQNLLLALDAGNGGLICTGLRTPVRMKKHNLLCFKYKF